MDDKWRVMSCPICSGYGLIWQGEGESECSNCNGGAIYIRPKGHSFDWPGGPANGIWTEEYYKKSTPVMPFQWHMWTNTQKEIEEFIIDRMGSFDKTLNTITCVCGFFGTIAEDEVHLKQAKEQFIKEHS